MGGLTRTKDNRETRQCLIKISRSVQSQTAEIPAFHSDDDDKRILLFMNNRTCNCADHFLHVPYVQLQYKLANLCYSITELRASWLHSGTFQVAQWRTPGIPWSAVSTKCSFYTHIRGYKGHVQDNRILGHTLPFS